MNRLRELISSAKAASNDFKAGKVAESEVNQTMHELTKELWTGNREKEFKQEKQLVSLCILLVALFLTMFFYRWRDKSSLIHYQTLFHDTQEELGGEIVRLRTLLDSRQSEVLSATQNVNSIMNDWADKLSPDARQVVEAAAWNDLTLQVQEKLQPLVEDNKHAQHTPEDNTDEGGILV